MQNTTTTTTNPVTMQLNSLLRGELSAIETYRQALAKVDTYSGAEQLRAIERDHQTAASTLRQHITRYGGDPSDSSGPWGGFAKLVEGAAKLFGDTASLKALKEGEEHGLKDYEEALNDRNMPAECQTLCREQIQKQRSHIATLDRLMSQF